MPDPWGAPQNLSSGRSPAPVQGYMNDAEFHRYMDATFGAGRWHETGGWRSQQREDWLRNHGAETVGPGVMSSHTLGYTGAPGARDEVVDGLSPQQVAQRIRATGLPTTSLYPEGAAGNQGPHLHINMAPGGRDPWGQPVNLTSGGAGAVAPGQTPRVPQSDPWGPPVNLTAAGPQAKGGDGSFFNGAWRLARSFAGGADETAGNALLGLEKWDMGGVRDQLAQARQTLAGMKPGSPGYAQQQARVANLTDVSQGDVLDKGLRGVGAFLKSEGEETSPQNRSPVESFVHGVGGVGAGIGAAVVDPAAGGAVFGGQGYEETFNEALAKGADETTARRAANTSGLIQGGLGMLPVSAPGDALIKFAGMKGVGAAATRVANAVASNAALGATMQTAENVNAQQTYDPNRPTLAGVPEAAAQFGAFGGAMHGAGEVIGALRPRETPAPAPAPAPEAPAQAPDMPETVAADAYRDMAGQRARPGSPYANDNTAGAAPQPTAAPPNEPVPAPDSVDAIPPNPPAEYETARQAQGAPAEYMPQAIADVSEVRRAAPPNYSLFQAIRDLGGIKLRNADGSATAGPDAQGILADVRRPGLVNNRSGMAPEAMAQALGDRGWFGPAVAQGESDASDAFATALQREADAGSDASAKVFHPESATPAQLDRRAHLEADFAEAGIGRGDTPAEAAAKLAAYRASATLQASDDMVALRQRATALGLTAPDGMTYDELLGDVVEREAIQGSYDGWAADHDERLIDNALTPEEHEWLSAPERGPRGEQGPAGPVEAAGAGAPSEPGAPPRDREPGAGPGGDRGRAAEIPQGAELAHVDPRAVLAAYDKGYAPFKDHLDDIEEALFNKTELTVPASQWAAEVGGQPYEAHLRSATRFSGGGGGEAAQDPWGAPHKLGEPLRMVDGRIEGELAPEPRGGILGGQEGRATMDRERMAPYGSVEHWNGFARQNGNVATRSRYKALYDTEAPKGAKNGKLMHVPPQELELPPGHGSKERATARHEITGTPAGHRERRMAEADAMRRHDFDTSFPPAIDIPGRSGPYDTGAPSLEEQRGVHQETGAAVINALHQMHRIEEALAYGIDPATGKPIKSAKRKEALHAEDYALSQEIEDTLAAYEEHFGGAARDRFASILRRRAAEEWPEAERPTSARAEASPGPEPEPEPKTETMKLGAETVEQGLLPGGERSARQAAAAREGALKPRKPQAEGGAGPLFETPDTTGDLFSGGGPDVKFSREPAQAHPDLFAAMQPIAERAAKGPFAEPAPDPAKRHFDQNHADLARLGELQRGDRATPSQLRAEAERLADEMGRYMDWGDVPLTRAERSRIQESGRPSADQMLRTAKAYAREEPGQPLYDADAYDAVVRRWYEKAGGARPAFSREAPRVPFYSAVERIVDRSPQRSATAEQWDKTLQNAPGVKREELEWLGVSDWLKMFGADQVPKEALLGFLRDNGVAVHEVDLTAPRLNEASPYYGPRVAHVLRKADDPLLELSNDAAAYREIMAKHPDADQDTWAEDALDSVMPGWQDGGTVPHYADWTTPGGANYHELLLTLPEVSNPPATHWETPGVMAHVRFDTRESPDGKKVLFVQEVQSDWHQKGRDQGYQQQASEAKITAALSAYNEARETEVMAARAVAEAADAWMDKIGVPMAQRPWHGGAMPHDLERLTLEPNEAQRMMARLEANGRASATERALYRHPRFDDLKAQAPAEHQTWSDAVQRLRAERLRVTEADHALRSLEDHEGIANAPFKTSWPTLVMKRIIAWGVEHGFDRVAWTTGDQQAERYDLTKHISEIRSWEGRDIDGEPDGTTRVQVHDMNGDNSSHDLAGPEHTFSNLDQAIWMTRPQLDAMFGKDLGEKLAQGGKDKDYDEPHVERGPVKIGGEGMRAFYDRNLVNMTNDIIKRYGSKVDHGEVIHTPAGSGDVHGEGRAGLMAWDAHIAQLAHAAGVDLATETPETLRRDADHYHSRSMREGGSLDDVHRMRQRASRIVTLLQALEGRAEAVQRQHGFDITGKMREAVEGGLPLFNRLASAEHVGFAGKGAHLVDDLYGVPARDADAKTQALIDKVHGEIARIAPHAKAKAFERLSDAGYEGQGYEVMGAAYRRGLQHVIAWSLESGDAIRTARHEAIHVLRAAGLFTPKEWHALEEAAVDQDWLGRYHISQRYPDVGWEMELEEAIADRFGDWRRDGDAAATGLPAFAKALFRRMQDLLTRVGSMARQALGRGVTAEEVMRRVDAGEVGARLQTAMRRPETAFSREAPPQGEEEPQARRARGAVNRFLGEGMDEIGRKVSRAAVRYMPDVLVELGDAIRMRTNPMAAGTARAQALAKDFANALREHTWEWGRMDRWIEKNFTPDERRAMWEAADEESIIRQLGREPGPDQGLAKLDPRQRAVVDELQRRAGRAFGEAQELGMTKAEGLPSYVPHMVIEMTAEGPQRLRGKRAGTSDGVGRNLSTTTGNLRQRKHLTPEQAEAAANAKFDTTTAVIRDIRTLAFATGKLEQAIAGRRLVNGIKEAGRQSGQTVVSDALGQNPDDVFTLDHPALRTWGPKFVIDHETGRLTTVTDPATGKPVMEAKPLYISREFEGPLKAVLSQTSGAVEKALMTLKGKAMSIIMYSPLMHNMVIYGKAVPAMIGSGNPMRLFDTYARGYRLKTNPEVMREAIRFGLDPIGRRYFNQDITAILEEPNINPGRSWTAQILGTVAHLAGKPVSAVARIGAAPGTDMVLGDRWGDDVKRAVDQFGDLWHNTFLWDRVADLQMGLYDIMRQGFIKHGLDPETAGRVAAHFANRYAGALPMEAMSKAARNMANIVLFSRSFTMTNLGAWKDAVAGLPPDIQAQIARDKGLEALQQAQGTARGKAMSMIAVDLAAAHVSMMLAGAAVWAIYNWLLKQPWNLQVGNPADKWILDHLGIKSQGPNEPGKEDRVLIGYDTDGTGIYMRLPTGKFIEDIFGWLTDPIGEGEKKFSPFMRFAYQLAANDKGFGHKLVDPYDKTPAGALRNLSRIVFGADISSLHSPDDFTGGLLGSFTPVGVLQGAAHWARHEGDPGTAMLQTIMPLFGLTVSKGAPGGPAQGDLFRAKDEHEFRVQEALPAIREMIRGGDEAGARAKMRELGIPPGLANYYVRTTRNPASRLTGRQLRDFRRYGSPDDVQRLDTDREQAQDRQTP